MRSITTVQNFPHQQLYSDMRYLAITNACNVTEESQAHDLDCNIKILEIHRDPKSGSFECIVHHFLL